MRALSHSETDHCIELVRVDRQLPSKPQTLRSAVLAVPKEDGTQGSACSSPAKSMN